jgi:hypothetical protein
MHECPIDSPNAMLGPLHVIARSRCYVPREPSEQKWLILIVGRVRLSCKSTGGLKDVEPDAM